METPHISTDTVASASDEGLYIAHIGQSNLLTKSHNFKLNCALHVPKLYQDLISMN